MATLRNITISTTLTCNEACQHCWVSAGPKRSDDLSTEELRSVLTEAAALGAEHVKFTGGEPLTRRDLPDLVGRAHQLGLRVSVETNGLLLSERMIDRLTVHGARPHFYVSIDAATPELHDRFRMRRGAFAKTLENLRTVRRLGHHFSVHTVVRRQILNELPAVHELVRSLGASQHKLILSLQNLGRGRDVRGDAELSVREVFDVLDQLPEQEFWDYGWDPEPDRPTRLMTTLPPAFQPPGSRITTCGWSRSFLSILSDGSVALCHGLYDVEEAIAGNLRTATLGELWERSSLFAATRRWSGADLAGICGNCRVRDACRGLCRASAIGEYRDLRAPYPMCQTLYDAGLFPEQMIEDATRDSAYARMP